MSAKQGHLLVVDDNEMNRDMLSRRLSRRGHRVKTAEDGQQALDMIAEQDFDVILLDIMMPGISGIEVLKTLRKTRTASELPIIMATAKSDNEDIIEALKLGANDYVTKPLNFPVVAGRVDTQLSLKKAQDALKIAHDRMKRDLEAAAQVQQALLPHDVPEMGSFSVAWKYCPCDELAGDFLNIFRINKNTVGMYVVDVSGHGVPAALFAFTVSRVLSPSSGSDSIVLNAESNASAASPIAVLTKLNKLFLFETNHDRYCTLLYATLDTDSGLVRLAIAGHPAPLVVYSENQAQEIDATGNPIGLLDDPEFAETTIQLNPGDRLYLYSDGLVENFNRSGEQFGSERLGKSARANFPLPLDESVSGIIESAVHWHGSEHFTDDISLIGLERKGE
jgi:sigma-B regulation protein RsbU (phosphoserine phosphatase)